MTKYAIRSDEYNWKVVEIKTKGEESNAPGEEYEVTVAYCKNFESAATFIFNREARMKAQMMTLIEAFKSAQQTAIDAVRHLGK